MGVYICSDVLQVADPRKLISRWCSSGSPQPKSTLIRESHGLPAGVLESQLSGKSTLDNGIEVAKRFGYASRRERLRVVAGIETLMMDDVDAFRISFARCIC